jgi:hypothetical protein
MLPERRTGAALGDTQMLADMLDEVSLGGLGQDQLVEGEIRDGFA